MRLGAGGELRQLNYAQTGAYFRGLENGKTCYDIWHTQGGVLQVTAMVRLSSRHLVGRRPMFRYIPSYRFGGGLNWGNT